MLGMLGGIGINKPRGMSVKMWCVGYLAVALGFDALAVVWVAWRLYMANLLASRAFRRRRYGISYPRDAPHQRRRCKPNHHGLNRFSLQQTYWNSSLIVPKKISKIIFFKFFFFFFLYTP